MTTDIIEILESFRDFVSTHDYQNNPILTAYVDVDSTKPDNQKSSPAWQIQLKQELKKIESGFDPETNKRKDKQKSWTHTEEMIINHLQQQKPTGRSVVIFTDFQDMIALDLPMAMETRVYYGLPQIKHLLFAIDQYKKYLAILFSGAEARFVEVFLTRSINQERVETEHELARRFGRKSKTLAGDRRDREFEIRFIREMAKEINQYFLENLEVERIIFGGNLKQAAKVNNALHPAVKDLVVDIVSMDFKLADHEIAEIIRPIAYAYEQHHDVTMVDNLLYQFNRKGPAVIEKQAVEMALKQGKVKTLVIPYPVDTAEFDSLIVEVTLSGAEVEFIYGEGANKLKQYGGIGAFLYYSV